MFLITVLVGVGVLFYLYTGKKSRIERTVDGVIRNMIKRDLKEAKCSRLYYHSAQAYAKQKSKYDTAPNPDDDFSSCSTTIDDQEYRVHFSRMKRNETHIKLEEVLKPGSIFSKKTQDALRLRNPQVQLECDIDLGQALAGAHALYERKGKQVPTWSFSFTQSYEFNYLIGVSVVESTEIPETFTEYCFANQEYLDAFNNVFAYLEREGVTRKKISDIGAELMKFLWRKLPDDKRTEFLVEERALRGRRLAQ